MPAGIWPRGRWWRHLRELRGSCFSCDRAVGRPLHDRTIGTIFPTCSGLETDAYRGEFVRNIPLV